jgi:hypothetical protein
MSMAGAKAGQGVKVIFERFKIKPVGLFGVPFPSWLPEVCFVSFFQFRLPNWRC